ncbi:MAG: hypothetical protein ACOX75_08370 [Lachnospiraceae bacterium]
MKKFLLIFSYIILLAIIGLLVFQVYWADDYSSMLSGTDTTSPEEQETEPESETENPDASAPVITGVKDHIVRIGSTIAYKEGVEVTDDLDPVPGLTVDSTDVNLSEVGIYHVVYIASDNAGNTSYAVSCVEVVPMERIIPSEAFELADEVLATIIEENMTPFEQLETVWWYLHDITYTGVDYGPVSDYYTNGYKYLKTRKGDCKCTYAAARLLIEALDFETIMVENRPEADTYPHYWNLVSIDGGESWYHFDPTCWRWQSDDINTIDVVCMYTDEQLREFSQNHWNEAHDWIAEDYPATPIEEFH